MSSYVAPMGSAQPAGIAFVDPTRAGSAWQQCAVGALGIALALLLVVGQVSVATTRGIQRNLHTIVGHLEAGNVTMNSIIDKAEPSTGMDQIVAQQRGVLERTRDTILQLNGEMKVVDATTVELTKTVSTMRSESQTLAGGVKGMSQDTARMAELLEPLPAQTKDTHANLDALASDSRAISGEVKAIGGKMRGYGFPAASGAKQ